MKSAYKKYFVRQADQTDCGVACLAMIGKFYGAQIPLEKLRNLSGTVSTGTSMLGLVTAAKEVGFDCQGFESEIENLHELNQPAILHVIKDNLLHYVVLFEIDDQKYVIADPTEGLKLLSRNQLEDIWKSKTLLRLEPKNPIVEQPNAHPQIEWLKEALRKDIGLLTVILVLGICYTILGLSTALYSQKLIDQILPEKDIFKLTVGIILLSFLLLFRSGLGYVRGKMLVTQSRNFNIRIMSGFFDRLLILPRQFFDHRKTGDLIARMNDTGRLQQTLVKIVGSVLIDVLLLISSVIFIVTYDVWLSLIVLIGIVVSSFFAIRFSPKIEVSQRHVMKAHAINESNYVDVIQGVPEIKAFGVEHVFSKATAWIYSAYQQQNFLLGKLGVRYQFTNDILGVLLYLGMILYLSWQVVSGHLLIGEMVALLTVSSGVFPAVIGVFMANIEIKEAQVALGRMQEFSELGGEDTDENKDKSNEYFQVLTVDRLVFSFPGRLPLLKEISLVLRKGEMVGLFGESGSGKSTLFKLIHRYYTIDKGLISYNENDMKDYRLSTWRAAIGIVPQEIKLFNGTVLDNILMGDQNLDPENIKERLQRSELNELLENLPSGYHTILGEGGVNISGGQRQLIGLARVFVRNPQVWILDEAFSAMGRALRQTALRLIHQQKENTGVLLATHDVTLALQTDRLYTLVDGKVEAEGRPQELLLGNNLLARVWEESSISHLSDK